MSSDNIPQQDDGHAKPSVDYGSLSVTAGILL